MVLYESVINTYDPEDLEHLIAKFAELEDDERFNGELTYPVYLKLVIIYMNYVFKLQEMEKQKAPAEEIRKIKETLAQMEKDYYMGIEYTRELDG